jgi:glyoxylase-like metal-dependent hydrolase (beta-lactamase superfamily II)
MNVTQSAITVSSISHPPFGTNTYFLTKENRAGCVVIDPGGWGTPLVEQMLARLNRRVDLIILTHEHFDHIGSLPDLLERATCPVICSRECAIAIADPMKNFSRYLINRDVACPAETTCCEDIENKMLWDGSELRFVSTPGHSPGGICIRVDNLLFSGDTLMWGRKRAIHLPGGDKQQLQQSVNLLFSICGPETLVYPGHGEPFRLEQARTKSPAPAGS